MNFEENRLYTFNTWPSNAPVNPRLLAGQGFFATCNFLETECNWCHCRINEWHYGDEIEERHRMVNPHCSFLVNSDSCNNVPLVLSTEAGASTQTASDTQQPINLLVEANRLSTFKNWPNPNISPQSLAKAGFFYLNRSDEVKCAWCKGVIAKWEKQDNAFEEHKRFFPECPRVQLGPLIEMASEGIRDLGIQQISPPKKPKFSSLDARLRTYTNWPIGDIQRPELLAHAGLYYQDVDDHVRCFHCNIGLRSWQKEDDPWFEHTKWYPQCQFVRLVKGANYVQQVQDATRQNAQQQHQPHVPICPTMTLDEAMTTSPVLQALEIGIDGGSIRNATQRQLLSTGRPYETVEDLVKAVFDDRNAEDDNAENNEHAHENEGAGASVVREVSRFLTSIFGETDARTEPTNTVTLASSEGVPENAVCLVNIPELPVATTSLETPNPKNTQCETEETTLERNNVKCASLKQELSPVRSLSLEEENRKLKDARLCKVCLDDEVGVVFLPCGHLVTCVQCAPGVNQCPMCRTDIKGFVRTFLS